jgi:hypothetical protein
MKCGLLLLLVCIIGGASCQAQERCAPKDYDCLAKAERLPTPTARPRFHRHSHTATHPSVAEPTAAVAVDSDDLVPVRQFLRSSDIPPADVGAYGLLVLKSKATTANQEKLLMVCQSYIAHFAPSESIPDSVPMSDRMITIWPLMHPESASAKADDCQFAVKDYDLFASEKAINDAIHQKANFDGVGPFLVGWSPSSSRGKIDKIVLVVDLSKKDTQAGIDREFDFWKSKIVEDPSLWRHGWSIESIRQAIKDFSDQYGQDVVDSIKLAGAP